MTLTNIRWVSGGEKHLAGAAGSHCYFTGDQQIKQEARQPL